MDSNDSLSADNCPQIWPQALENIRNELSEQSFRTWFEFVNCKSFENNTLDLYVPDNFYGEWLKENYQEIIKTSVAKVTKERPEVVFTVKVETPRKSREDSSGEQTLDGRDRVDQLVQAAAKTEESKPTSSFRSIYSFDSFVIGPGNRFAHAAALSVSEAPAKAYNPLFIYGPSGLGKTHLLQSIANEILKKNPTKKVFYTSSEEFTNALIHAIQTRTTTQFRQKFRSLDVLLVDDIQFIAGKESTQEEFFHTFNALYDAQKQIVLSSDRTPKEIPSLEKRLLSRFEWGLTTDIQPPDFETRVAILKKKLEREQVEVSNEILFYIAENIRNNIRELEGALIRVCAYFSLTDSPMTLDAVKQILKVSVREEKRLTIDDIVEHVAHFYQLKPADLKSKKRTKNIAHPRQIAMYLARKHTSLSFPEIGDFLGGRGHATVVHGFQRIEELVKQEDPRISILKDIQDQLQVEHL